MEKIKKQWPVLTILGTVIVLGFGAGIAWSENDSKVKSLEQRIAQVEDTQNTQAKLADKLFDFTMSLWNIEPAARKKWKAVPMVKPDSVVCEYEWTEFEGLDRWLHYKYHCDSLGVPSLLVDTLHVVKKED